MFPYKLPWIRFSPLILFALLLNSLQASAVPIKYDENTSRNNTMEIEPIESKNTTGKEMEKLELLHNHHHHGHHHVHVHVTLILFALLLNSLQASAVPIKYDENTSRNNTMEIEPIESKNTTGKEMEKLELLHNHHHHGHHHVHVH
uniref:Histidine-rich glycoprotein n=1 Tax=Bursaphelenchus xylophilus TaxID=6326 RepID=A0A1I7SHN8_BURXY